MANAKIVKEWLFEADEDFEFGAINLREQDKFYSRICFFFQQAAEKYLKAYIVANNLPFKKIHDLTKLLKICMQKDNSFDDLKEEAIFLTDFYIDTRYPAIWPVGRKREEAEKAEEFARQIGDFVKGKLKIK